MECEWTNKEELGGSKNEDYEMNDTNTLYNQSNQQWLPKKSVSYIMAPVYSIMTLIYIGTAPMYSVMAQIYAVLFFFNNGAYVLPAS